MVEKEKKTKKESVAQTHFYHETLLLANFTEIIWVIDCGDWIGKLLKNNPLGPALGKLG